MQARDGSAGRAGPAEAVDTGDEVGRAHRLGVELRQAIEVGAEGQHVPGLAPHRQPVEQQRQPAEQQDAGRANQRCPALLDVGMIEREPGLANGRRGVRDRM